MFLPLILVGGIVYAIANSSKGKRDDGLDGVKPTLLKFPKGTTQAQKDLITSWAQGNDNTSLNGAYYKRNNSYSRSYNASQAESEGRFPLNRAAQYIGLSSAAFKKGAEHADLVTTEWHHVGKYANKIDYWDVSKESEIYNSYKFWFGAMTKSNRDWCMENLVRIAKQRLNERLKNVPIPKNVKGFKLTQINDFRYYLDITDLSKKDKIFKDVKKIFYYQYGFNQIEIQNTGSEKSFVVVIPVYGRIWQEIQKSIKKGRAFASGTSIDPLTTAYNELNISNNKFKLFVDWGTNNPKIVDKANSLKELYSIYLEAK